MSTNKSIATSATVIGLATLCSRLLGFFRDLVIAKIFGVYLYAQAFVVAFRLPNLFRDLFAEGAANSALVPILSEYALKRNRQEFWSLVNVLLNILLVMTTAITILGVISAPFLVRIVAPGFISDFHKFSTTVLLTRIFFPYLVLVSMASFVTAVLNTLQHFTLPAFASCFFNLSLILAALVFGEGNTGLAVGVLLGGIFQLAVQIPILYQKGFRLQLFLKKFYHPACEKIARLFFPRVASSAFYQLNNFVDSIFGSLSAVVGEGGVAILYFAYRLVQFPLGIFSTALSQASLPTLSMQALQDSPEALKKTLSFNLRFSALVLLPATVGCCVLSRFFIENLFRSGRFDSYAVENTARVLFFYSLGLIFYGGTKIIQSCFFALKDTVTPTKVLALNVALNIIFNSILMFPLKIAGLALATSFSSSICFLLLFGVLYNRLKPFNLKEIFISLTKITVASLGMGLVCWLIANALVSKDGILGLRFVKLGLVSVSALSSFIFFAIIFRVEEMRQILKWLLRKS